MLKTLLFGRKRAITVTVDIKPDESSDVIFPGKFSLTNLQDSTELEFVRRVGTEAHTFVDMYSIGTRHARSLFVG